MKTPLMLIRNSTDGDREFRELAQEQVTRMLGIVEGELESHSKKLEAIEKRGRGLRAEIGRKVEELAGEELLTVVETARLSAIRRREGDPDAEAELKKGVRELAALQRQALGLA